MVTFYTYTRISNNKASSLMYAPSSWVQSTIWFIGIIMMMTMMMMMVLVCACVCFERIKTAYGTYIFIDIWIFILLGIAPASCVLFCYFFFRLLMMMMTSPILFNWSIDSGHKGTHSHKLYRKRTWIDIVKKLCVLPFLIYRINVNYNVN